MEISNLPGKGDKVGRSLVGNENLTRGRDLWSKSFLHGCERRKKKKKENLGHILTREKNAY